MALPMTISSCGDDDTAKPTHLPSKTDKDKDEDKETPGNTNNNDGQPSARNIFFLCFGQSNMEGNAAPIDKDKTVNPRFQSYVCYAGEYDGKEYKVGDLRKATPPLCRTGQPGGIGVTDYFGRTLVEKLPESYNVRVAVVALGGSSIRGFLETERAAYLKQLKDEKTNWLLGYYQCYDDKPYDRMIEVAQKAIKNGDEFGGILFHQGESDWDNKNWNVQVKTVYNNICEDLNIEPASTPFIAGQVTANNKTEINNIPNFIKNSYVIHSDDCENDSKGENGTVKPGDNNSIHFNHAGYEEMGKRYAEKMFEILKEKYDDIQ